MILIIKSKIIRILNEKEEQKIHKRIKNFELYLFDKFENILTQQKVFLFQFEKDIAEKY